MLANSTITRIGYCPETLAFKLQKVFGYATHLQYLKSVNKNCLPLPQKKKKNPPPFDIRQKRTPAVCRPT